AWGLLFEDPALVKQDAADATRMIQLAKLWGEAPGPLTGLLGKSPFERFLSGVGLQPPNVETANFINLLAGGWKRALADTSRPVTVGDQVTDLAALGATDPGRLGYYYVADEQNRNNHLLLVRVFERTDYTSMGGMAEAITGIRTAAREAGAAFPEFNIALTGRPALEADEMITTDRDSRRSEVV